MIQFTAKDAFYWLLIGLTLFLLTRCSASREGKYAEKERAEAQVHDSLTKLSTQSSQLAAGAVRVADSLQNAAKMEARKDARVEQRTDSALRSSAAERNLAHQLLHDSTASMAALRERLEGLDAASVRDSVAVAAERTQHTQTVLALTRALQADSTALGRQTDALNALRARAESSERLNALYRADKGGWLRNHVVVSAGYGGTLSKGEIRTGPTISAGIRLWP